MTALVAVCLLALGFGPCWRIPGGELSGEVVPGPVTDWSFVDENPACELEVRPADPYSITAYCFSVNGVLYVGCLKCSTKTWPTYVLADPNARIRMQGRIHPVRATRVTNPSVIDAAWHHRTSRHVSDDGTRPLPEDYWLFQLDSR